MQNIIINPRKALNKAFLKLKPSRAEIDDFKTNLIQFLDRTNDAESEEFHKNLVSDFLKKTYYEPNHFINTKGRNDLVIHNSEKAKSTVGVIIEAKKTTNKAEMLTNDNINVKAFHELILYYLRERLTTKNLEVKQLIATNINHWFIFDANVFEKLFAQNKTLIKQFNDFENQRLTGQTTDFFYNEIAKPFVEKLSDSIEYTYFDIREYEQLLRNNNPKDDNKLIALFKLLSPQHILKLPFANDSNSLDKRFYGELLHIIGLTEVKEGGKKLIKRNKEGERNTGSLLENTIIQLDSLDKINRLANSENYGENHQERLFNVALELCITWINRILFLKLLEAQLIGYHKGDKSYEFLSLDKIKDFDDLNTLFFQVLARKHNDRNNDVKQPFEKVPYLNSSLFEPTELEHSSIIISNLIDTKIIPVYGATVLKSETGKKNTGELTTLEYLFGFLNAYDFSSEGSEAIQEDNKSLINASVLGLIFEKINGYKDGSFFTPGFITMYMCRETIRRGLVQKFNETKNWNCKDFSELTEDLKQLIKDDKRGRKEVRKEANDIINDLKICDPAVGSGHFLVSALNELISVKSDLSILVDKNYEPLNDYEIEIVNDELIITNLDDNIFEYHPTNKESQRIQETLFHEKQTIIENCLFGVDININSVKICRLRLWIELLKNAYYFVETEHVPSLQTLPNIDINIKCGNSLISRFPLNSNMKQLARTSKWSIFSYQNAVQAYKNSTDKDAKRNLEKLIRAIKSNYITTIQQKNPILQKYYKLKQEYDYKFPENGFFVNEPEEDYGGNTKKRKEEKQRLETELKKVTDQLETEKLFYAKNNAFEWRFEFPEVLAEDGSFIGFDIVVGNPPYGIKPSDSIKKYYSITYDASNDIYSIFIELSKKITHSESNIGFIIPIMWLTGVKYISTRKLLVDDYSLVKAINLPYNIFTGAYVDTGIYFFEKKSVDESLVFEFTPKVKISINDLQLIKFKTLTRKSWTSKIDLKINLNEAGNLIFQKLDAIATKLNDFSKTVRGILANKSDYKTKESKGLKRVFIGNMNRYALEQKYNFLQYNEKLKEKPKSYNFFCGERILVRRIINRQFKIMATFVKDEFICKKDIYILKLNDNGLDYKFVLGLLNSKLISYYKTKTSGSAKKDDFTQITLGDLRQLPIPNVDNEKQVKIMCLVDKILNAKKKDFTANTLILEKAIDQMVYKLYGLTKEEIEIVENSEK